VPSTVKCWSARYASKAGLSGVGSPPRQSDSGALDTTHAFGGTFWLSNDARTRPTGPSEGKLGPAPDPLGRGADLPTAQALEQKAWQVISIGEAFDFEFEPATKGAEV
jgi:hypothetical protein